MELEDQWSSKTVDQIDAEEQNILRNRNRSDKVIQNEEDKDLENIIKKYKD